MRHGDREAVTPEAALAIGRGVAANLKPPPRKRLHLSPAAKAPVPSSRLRAVARIVPDYRQSVRPAGVRERVNQSDHDTVLAVHAAARRGAGEGCDGTGRAGGGGDDTDRSEGLCEVRRRGTETAPKEGRTMRAMFQRGPSTANRCCRSVIFPGRCEDCGAPTTLDECDCCPDCHERKHPGPVCPCGDRCCENRGHCGYVFENGELQVVATAGGINER